MRYAALVLFVYLLGQAAAQCELWGGDPSLCTDVLGGREIYIGNGTQADIVAATSVVSYLSAVQDPCKSDALIFACLRYFPLCNTTYTLGRRPCQSTCNQFFSSCSSYITQYADLLADIVPANCSLIDGAGAPLFPNGTYIDQGAELNCSSLSVVVSAECPYPLEPFPNPACFIPCPRQFNTPRQFAAMKYLTLVLALFSFLFELFLIPAYGLFPLARRWPARLLLYYFIANFIGATGIIISWRGEDIWCQANHDTHTIKTNKICGVQGALLVYSVLSFELWWLSLIGNLCYTLYLKKRFPIPDIMLELFMHSINWGYPLFVIIQGISTERLEYVQDSPTCFLRGEQADWYIWFPMTGIFSLGIVLMVPVVLFVLRNAGAFGLRRQFRFLALIAYNTMLFAFFVALWALARDKDDQFTDVVRNYVICILAGGEDGVDCKLRPQPPYPVRLILYTLLGASGAVFAGIFLSDGALIRHWRMLYQEKRLPWTVSTGSLSSRSHTTSSRNATMPSQSHSQSVSQSRGESQHASGL